jgi:hypothetical protein
MFFSERALSLPGGFLVYICGMTRLLLTYSATREDKIYDYF